MNFRKNEQALAGITMLILLLGGAFGAGLFGLFGTNLIESILPITEIFYLIIIIVLGSILVASIRFIQSRVGKIALILIIGGAMVYFIMKLMGYLQ